MRCKTYINLLRSEKNNINQYIFIITIINKYYYKLNCQLINYKNEVILTEEIIENIKILTLQVHLTIIQ